MRFNRAVVLLSFAFLWKVSLVAQEPVAEPAGTQVATEQTSAASANADALRKAAQNPIANLVSVPVQNNNNFGTSPEPSTCER
jgi:hypothetical protein